MARPRKLTPLDEIKQGLETELATVTEHLDNMDEYKKRRDTLQTALADLNRLSGVLGMGGVQQRKKPGPKPGAKRAAAKEAPKRRGRRPKQETATA